MPVPKSLAKSACQKNIRRGRVEQAVRCAKACIDADPLDFSRRVMVLAPEEVSIHPLMVDVVDINARLSHKGEQATDNDYDIMLTIVRDIAMAKKRDTWEYDRTLKFDFETTTKQIDRLAWWQRSILHALEYRGSIGGLKGDVLMFKNMVPYLIEKFIRHQGYTYEIFYENLADPLVNHHEVGRLRVDDIPYFAVDIHSFPPIVKMCLRKAYWEYGEKKYRPTEMMDYAKSVCGLVKAFLPVGNGTYTEETFPEELVRRTIWSCVAGRNDKVDYKTGKPLDLLEWEEMPDEDKKIIRDGLAILTPIWESAADWYIKKKFEE
jgi:hypothetical protein|nr:MAG TPA: AAA ATPase [Caudoviricetes sp.]